MVVCSASYTEPMPPRLIFRSSRYGPDAGLHAYFFFTPTRVAKLAVDQSGELTTRDACAGAGSGTVASISVMPQQIAGVGRAGQQHRMAHAADDRGCSPMRSSAASAAPHLPATPARAARDLFFSSWHWRR